MKTGIHPQYNPNAVVTCACGNTFEVGSTQPTLRVDLCSNCHPFYTGKQNFVDTARRIEKFQEKQTQHSAAGTVVRSKAEKELARKAKRADKTAAGK